MLLRLLKNHRRSGFVLFPFILAGIWMNHLMAPYPYTWSNGEERFALFGLVHRMLPGELLTRSLVAIILLALNSLFLFRIYREHLFPKSWSMLPAILFILLSSGIGGFQTLHPVWLALPFLSLAIDRLFVSFDLRKPYSLLFNTGLFLGLGSLFWFHLLILLPAFIIGANMMARDTRWREGTLLFLGTLVPWTFAFSVAFLTDSTRDLAGLISGQLLTQVPKLSISIPVMLFIGFTALLTLAGSYSILQHYDQNKVSFRRFYIFFFLLFISCVPAYFFIPGVTPAIFILAALPVTFLLSNYLESFRRYLPGDLILLLILALVIYIQLL